MRSNSAKLFSHPDVVAERGYGIFLIPTHPYFLYSFFSYKITAR
jgi:hypothetical protein